jgi:hypothetical protein
MSGDRLGLKMPIANFNRSNDKTKDHSPVNANSLWYMISVTNVHTGQKYFGDHS